MIFDQIAWRCGAAERGTARIFGEALGRSTVAHFARKVRGTNIMAAKHEQKIQQSHAQKRWSCSLRVRGLHFASKVSYNAGAATDDYASQCKSPCGLMNLLVSPNIKRWTSNSTHEALGCLSTLFFNVFFCQNFLPSFSFGTAI